MSARSSHKSARTLALAGVMAVASMDACAQAAATMPDGFRRIFEDGAASGAFPSIAVGLLEGKEQQTWTFGTASPTSADALATVYEIGAVTDVFTGMLVAQAVLEGKLRLNQPLRDVMPAGLRWADEMLADTPLAALVAQQSRLPATPPNLFPAHEEDPYAAYAEGDLLTLLANGRVSANPTNYSALNAALLAIALRQALAVDYDRALAAKILEPLGLSNTGFEDSSALLAGHAFGAEVPHWHYAALAGAAGLRSTLGDLMALVRFNLNPETSPLLRSALLLSRQSRGDAPGGAIAFGWNIHEVAADEQTWPLLWRASETGGFSAFIGFRTDQQRGLVLLANNAVNLAPIGIAWLSGTSLPAPPPSPFRVDTAQLPRYAGLYRLLTGTDATVRSDGVSLSIQLRGEPPWPLHAIGEDAFVYGAGSIGVTFVRNIDRISGLMLRTNDEFVSAERLSARAPRLEHGAANVDAKVLAELTGDYTLDASTMLRIAALPGGLSAQLTGSRAMPMHAFAPDRFADADGANRLRVRRDEHGQIDQVTLDFAGGERTATPAHWRAPFAQAPKGNNP